MKLYTMMLQLLNAAATDTSSVAETVSEGMGWHPEKALETLDNMGIGMLVIFVIIGVIIIATMLVNKIFSKK
ncbi:MAG: hypothetical protein E7525_01570 [Ruminococcaceae bacterium]|nr:hypothetical protein [Oscillospiraceae bacterium]